MILFNYPEERSFPFKIYIPPDLLEQVKAQQHRSLKAELHRRTFDKLLKKLSQTDISGKEHIEEYLRHKYRRNCRANTLCNDYTAITLFMLGHSNLEMTLHYARLSDKTREEEYFKAMNIIESEEIHEPDQRDRQLPPPFERRNYSAHIIIQSTGFWPSFMPWTPGKSPQNRLISGKRKLRRDPGACPKVKSGIC